MTTATVQYETPVDWWKYEGSNVQYGYEWFAAYVAAWPVGELDDRLLGSAYLEAKADVLATFVTGYLDALPRTPVGLSQIMQDWGIKGTPGGCISCPIHELIKVVFGIDSVVGDDEMRIKLDIATWRRIKTPTHIREFIDSFDRGAFPALVAEIKTEENDSASFE